MRTITRSLLVMALAAVTQSALADLPVERMPPQRNDRLQLQNIELSRSGELTGQYVTSVGTPLTGQTLIFRLGKQNRKVVTDDSGRFRLPNLTGGQCVITADEDTYACRLWTRGTAPPNSLQSIAVIQRQDIAVRGQSFLPAIPRPSFPRPAFLPNSMARLGTLTRKQKVGIGLLITAGITVAVVQGDNDEKPDGS